MVRRFWSYLRGGKLSTTYKIRVGDTFEIIARKAYGVETAAGHISGANPGVVEPLTPGTEITLPDLPEAPQNTPQQAVAQNEDEVAILIDGIRFRRWSSVRIVRSLDAMDIIEFEAPFDQDLPGFRETFRPFSYKDITVTVGGLPLFTGTMVAVSPIVDNDRRSVSVSGYSRPGVLNDCTAPASAYPLEFDSLGIRDIAAKLSDPFGVSVELEGDPGAIFDRVASPPSKKILSFLIELAKERNLVVSSTSKGALLFTKSTETGSPVAILEQGFSPVTDISPFFSPQEYYSHITGLEPVVTGLQGSQFTVKNPRLLGTVRPIAFTVQDTQNADVKTAVEAKAARMFGGAVTYIVGLDTWRDPSGTLWRPNTTIKLTAPGAMIYSEYEFVIRSIEFFRTASSGTAALTLSLPGAFSGKIPETLPWDG